MTNIWENFCIAFCSRAPRAAAGPPGVQPRQPGRGGLLAPGECSAWCTLRSDLAATSRNSHWKSKAIVQDQSPGCDIFYDQMGSAFISAIKYKQLVFQTAWPFTVANLHIFILNEMVSGHSPWISNEIFRPPDILHSVADTFSRLHNLLSLIRLTTGASLPMHQQTDSSQELRNAGE